MIPKAEFEALEEIFPSIGAAQPVQEDVIVMTYQSTFATA
jgi:hypothetical protein